MLTSKKERGPSRDWLSLAKTTRAQSKIRAWFKRESREDSERSGREILQESLRREGLPPQKIAGSPLLADVIREMGFRKADDFYIALGGSKISAKVVTQKVMASACVQGESAVEPADRGRGARGSEGDPEAHRLVVELRDRGRGHRRRDAAPGQVLPARARRPDRGLHLAGQGHHDPPRELPERGGAQKNPERFTKVDWDAEGSSSSFRVELEIDGWDRTRLLEDLSRMFAETGINILEARCTVVHPMVKNRFVVEVGDTQALKMCIQRLRNIESVFDAYRVTPTG